MSTLEGFMTNVCQNVKVGGLFIGTCYDGKAVFNAIKDSGDESITINSGMDVYWKCEKKYKETVFEDDISSLGYEIDVFQKSIGLIHTEYLVNFDYLTRVMENYGFKVVKITPFKEIYEGLVGPSKEKYRELERMPEKFITFLNNTFVFQKVTDVDPTLVRLDRSPITEKEKQVEMEKELEEKKKLEEQEEEAPQKKEEAAPKTATASKKTRKCKETEELVDDVCRVKCKEGEFRNPVTKRCNKTKKAK
jgi:hypothetical protein